MPRSACARIWNRAGPAARNRPDARGNHRVRGVLRRSLHRGGPAAASPLGWVCGSAPAGCGPASSGVEGPRASDKPVLAILPVPTAIACAPSPSGSRRWVSILALRTAAGSFLFVALALIWTYAGETRLSASELLRRSELAQSARLGQVDQPVVHQRLRIIRTVGSTRSSSPSSASSSWDVWHDTTAGRLRERRTAKPADYGLADEVAGVLRANRRDPRQPLSPASYSAWRQGVVPAEETLTSSWLTGGIKAFRLKTIVQAPVAEGRIAETEPWCERPTGTWWRSRYA